jgi:prophage tail gpP-like protein
MIQLKVGGYLYGGWTAIEVNRSMEALSGYFAVNVTDRNNVAAAKFAVLKPGDSCQILVNGRRVLDGYIDKVRLN